MIVAGKTLARTATALFQQPARLDSAQAELDRRRGSGYVHMPLLGNRQPPLDYRD